MQISNLKVSKRETQGKEISRKLRRQGIVPAVVYGGGVNFSVQIEKRALSHVMAKNPTGHPIVELEVADSDFNSHVMLKETQRDPISGDIIHADFLKIDMTKKVTITVPLKIEGKSKGVTEEGGVLNVVHRELNIEALPNAIPESISIDISHLALNDSIHISDIHLSDDIKILEDPEIAIVSVVSPKVEVKEEVAVEGEEAAAEGEEGKAEVKPDAADAKEEKSYKKA